MIMFVFFLISLINIIFALPMVEKASISDIHIEGTTVVPHDIIDRILISNVKKSSNHLHESVQALQSAMKILFPKKDQNEKNFSVDQQILLIGCLINRDKASEKQRRACKGLHEKNDKNVFYEFDDKSLSDHLPIHVEHINVGRVKKPINDTIEEIQKPITIENRLINNETDGEKIHLDSMSESLSSQNLVNSSTVLDMKLKTTDSDGSRNDSKEEIFQWVSNNYTIDKTTMRQVPQLQSIYSMNEQDDDNDFSILDEQNLSSNNQENLTDENHNSRTRNNSTMDIWSIGRLSNDRISNNVLLTDLAKALETLESIVDGNDLDSAGDQISFKPADLRSIIRSQKFSWKSLQQFLNTIKNLIEKSFLLSK